MLRASIILLVLAMSPAAYAQSRDDTQPPTFKRAVTVDRDVVRIGDLIDNAGAVADVPIFRSPDLGTTGHVSTATVLAALKSHNLTISDAPAFGEIEVTRAARVIASSEIELRVARAFAGQYGLPEAERLAAVFDNGLRTLYLDPSASADLQVARALYEPRSKRFDITFFVPASSGARAQSLRYTGSLFEPADVVVATRTLTRGDVIRTSDVAIERRPRNELAADTASALDDVVGFIVRQPMRAGQVLRRNDLTKPDVVKRDEAVTLIYTAPGIMLTVRGKALEAGAEGDVISVQNVQSKRTIQGTVSGPGQVTVASTAPAFTSEFTASAAPQPSARTE